MKTKDAIALFGSIKGLADALGIWPQGIYRWGEDVPELRAYQIRDFQASGSGSETQANLGRP